MSLIETSLTDLLAAFSSSDPTPGGGSASALASAVGASLLVMVAGLPKTRNNSDEDRAALARATAALLPLRQQLADAVDADTRAYDAVVAAFKLPKQTTEEKEARKAAVQQATRGATDVPLSVMRMSAEAVAQGRTIAAHGHRAASSDVGVALALLSAGAHGARLNVEINLDGLSDAAYVARMRNEVTALAAQLAADAQAAEQLLRG